MKKVSFIFFLLLIPNLFIMCTKLLEEPDSSYTYNLPETFSDGIMTSSLEAEKIDTKMMEHLTDLVNTDYYKNIHSIVVIRNNQLVYEQYFNGYDQSMLHNLYSASKSFTSCMTGIAIEKGWIPDTNASIVSYFPEYENLKNDGSGRKNITIRHLLTMTSGLECNDWDPTSAGNPDNLNKQKDMLGYLFELPIVAAPEAKA